MRAGWYGRWKKWANAREMIENRATIANSPDVPPIQGLAARSDLVLLKTSLTFMESLTLPPSETEAFRRSFPGPPFAHRTYVYAISHKSLADDECRWCAACDGCLDIVASAPTWREAFEAGHRHAVSHS